MRDGRPSRTAIKIAWIVTFASEEPAHAPYLPAGMHDDLNDLLRAVLRTFGVQRWILNRPRYRSFLRWFERKTCPGAFLHMVIRKRYVCDQVSETLDAGARRLVVLGAGLDVLGRQLAEHPGLRSVLEVDHPGMQARKRRALQSLGWLTPPLHLLPVDFQHTTLTEALSPEFADSPAEPTVFVAEGLLMYLEESVVKDLFRQLAALAAPGSRIVFTTIPPDARGRPSVPGRLGALVRWSLTLTGEPLRWSIARGELESFVAAEGWALRDQPDVTELRRRYELGDSALMQWEMLNVAELQS